ncbi:spore protease YyaC [Paenibacillus caui]|uniref:spore protease YyaC n=1 Tax=Paenibacillus caui TaxID=2873927 RepID=UPI001CA8581E|nr:spore protease YyaC [Paenibacillus caui]
MTTYRDTDGQGGIAVREKVGGERLEGFFRDILTHHPADSIVFVCIGTDRSTGDALGPLTGSRLREYGISSVIGTLPEPCDADNLKQKLLSVPEDKTVIAIDACLGSEHSVGSYLISSSPLLPAESVGGKLPAVGDYSIAAVVNRNGPRPYQALQVTSLYRVMKMADEIAAAAAAAFKRIRDIT